MNARALIPEDTAAAELTELVMAARLGDAHASSALWARCGALAKVLARRWAGSAADVEDLSQEALLRAFESFDSLRDPAALLGWLHVIVVRSVAHRMQVVRRKRALLLGGSDPDALPAHDAQPDFQVDLHRLLATLGSLPQDELDCFWLRRAEGMRFEEIAKETALSTSTIRRRLGVAERRLAKRLSLVR